MAAAETAKLLASLDMDTRKFTAGGQKAIGTLDKLSAKTVAIGTAVGVGIERLAEAGIRKLSGAISGGLDSLAQLESAVTSVDAAIAQVGLTGKVTGAQIATWANEIEASIGAAFDDKEITQAATTLLRFGKVTQDNLRPALVVMTDLATKTGSVDSAATLLAKALADPTKAAGKLARSGVILTKVEQDQIKALVKAGDAAGAQKIILDSLAKSTKGAAEASQGPYARSQRVLADVVEDAQRALATGLLPVIEEVRKELSNELAKPETLRRIKEFGEGLASGLRSVVGFVKSIPWDQVGAVLKGAATFGQNIASAFMGLPTEAKGLILGLAALNKLSGGAVIKVGVDLLSGAAGGLFQQFLGRGSIANPMVVVPVGGSLTPGGGVTPTGGVGVLGKMFLVGEAIGLVAAVNSVRESVEGKALAQAQGIHETLTQSLAGPQTARDLQIKLAGIEEGIAKLKADPVAAFLITGPTIAELEKMRSEVVAAISAQSKLTPGEMPAFKQPTAAVAKAMATLAATQKTTGDEAARKAEAQKTALERVRSNAITNRMETVSSQKSGDSQIVSAIERNRPIITVNVDRTGNVTTAYDTGTTINGVHPGLR